MDKATHILDKHFQAKAEAYVGKLIEYGLVEFNEAGRIVDSSFMMHKNIIRKTHTKADFTSFIKEYLINYQLNVGAFTTMAIGDPAFYKEKVKSEVVSDELIVDYFKRAKEMFSPKSNPDTRAVYNGLNEDGTPNTFEVREHYNSITLKDENIKAISYDAIKEALDSLVKSGKISQKTADSILDEYGDDKINHADAQAFITPEFYKETMIANDLWSDAMEVTYQKALKGEASLEELVVFQPIKPFMFNHNFNSEYNFMVPVQNKNSEFVLFPFIG